MNYKTMFIPTDQLLPNPHNPFDALSPDKYADLRESIRHVGVIQPLLVVEYGKKWMVMSGHNRLRVAKELGVPSLRCDVLPEADAPRAYDTELFRRHLNDNEYKSKKDSIVKRTKEWYEKRFAEDLEPELYERYKGGTMSPDEAARLLSLSRGQQRDLIKALQIVKEVEVRASGNAQLTAEIARMQKELEDARARESDLSDQIADLAEKEKKAKGLVKESREHRDEAVRQLERAKERESAALKGADKVIKQTHTKELEEYRQRLVEMSKAAAEAKKAVEKVQEEKERAIREAHKYEAETKAMSLKLRTIQEATTAIVRQMKNPDGVVKRFDVVASELTAIRDCIYQYTWLGHDVSRFERQATEIVSLVKEVVAAAKANEESGEKAA